MRITCRLAILSALLTILQTPPAMFAQGTAFTYQGRLNSGGTPANGSYDLVFSLYNTVSGGSQVGSSQTNTATGVTNGLFTVTLDFGAGVFDGNARWLQMGVRTNGGGAFTALAPRQPLISTPYAVYASNAGNAALAGSVSGGAITSAMLADGAVTSNKINASVLKALNLADDGSGAYAELIAAGRGMQTTDPLPFSDLLPVVTNTGPAPGLTFQLDGAAFGNVLGFSGREGISELYEYVVEVLSPNASLNPNSIMGHPGALVFSRNGRNTFFNGIITGCALAKYNGETLYTFRLEPALAYLGLNSDYRIYQDRTVPDIVKALYREITGENATDSLSGSYPTHTLAIQFAETDLNFFHRHLENEGAFYFFRQEEAATALVLGDAAGSFIASPVSSLKYYGNNATNASTEREYVRLFQKAVRESTQWASLDGYDFTVPRKELRSRVNAGIGSGEKYEYDARVTEPADSDYLSRIRAERFTTERNLIRGAGNAPDLRPGYTFTLLDQSGSGFGGSYVVTSVRHSAFRRTTAGGTSLYYGNQFEVLPANIPYRPARKSPKPVAPACTAVVTGPAAEEIYTDKYGRVKVQFHWDRRGASDEHSSGWIRVATSLAGKGWGAISVPRIGQEVLVEFVNGDPDQPVITGSLYNQDNMPPYALPAEATKSGIKTRSSKGGTTDNYNEIRFDDKKGAEELFIKAEKDLNMDVNHDFTVSVDNNLVVSVGNDAILSAARGVGINTPNDPSVALKVGGPVAATAFYGPGSGLSNLLSSALTGTISEVLLPNTVPRLNDDAAFNRSVTARVFIGSGAGLTNLPAANLTGTLSDARLSGNVARLNASQAFTGNNSFAGNVGIGTTTPEDARLDVEGNMHLNDYDLYLRTGFDRNHGLGWYGDGKLFAGVNVDGPVLYGCAGGGLGTVCGTATLALAWNNAGNVVIDPQGLNGGSFTPGLTFGPSSMEGIASKRTSGGNQYGLDFYTYGTNRLSITQNGRVGIGTTNPATALEVAGVAKATRFEGDGSALTGLSAVRSWEIVTTASVTTVANRGYVANSASRITFSLPAKAALGDTVRVTGLGAGGWQVNGTSVGTVSGQATNSVELLCVTSGNWRVLSRF